MRNKIGGDETERLGCKLNDTHAENTDVSLHWVLI